MATKNYDEALNNLSFLAKRFQGILELGASVDEVKVLLNQKDSLSKAVNDASKELASTQAKIAKANEDLKKMESDASATATKYNSQLQDLDKVVAEGEKRKEGVQKEYQAMMAAAQAQAAKVVADASEQAEKMKAEADTYVKEANARLKAIEDKIAKIKATL